jgi:hypothetical protein
VSKFRTHTCGELNIGRKSGKIEKGGIENVAIAPTK